MTRIAVAIIFCSLFLSREILAQENGSLTIFTVPILGPNMLDRASIVSRVSYPSVLTKVTPFSGLERREYK